jgi:hypothetical protein
VRSTLFYVKETVYDCVFVLLVGDGLKRRPPCIIPQLVELERHTGKKKEKVNSTKAYKTDDEISH